MSMENSVELGWLVTKPHSDDYYDDSRLFKDMPENEDFGHEIPMTAAHMEGTNPCPLSVETHPHDLSRVFVSWVTLYHGWTTLTEPKALGQLVRQFIHRHDPEAVVEWTIIETRR